ncbi:Golgi-associated plant pathogenesis-related protein 1 [Octopus vulgaris]|uniref:Golgi-associated plant pathogenesis-related protein 1 n=1 Tax=Octopus vulgaris TaxID=6645 RepID=A0AA36BPM4_OCTVU|nr:Golgi-associated plant pathogenesis-related protein 1 [Octopus vulgaris]
MGRLERERKRVIEKVIPESFKQFLDSKPEDKPKKSIEGSPEEQKMELERSALEAHNRHRAKHGVPDLTLAEDLCEMAQKWADYLASINAPKHSDENHRGKNVGENLANKWSSDGELLTGEEATNMWYNEIKDYDFDKPGFRSGIGHFTQVVWEESKEFGIGRGRTANGGNFVVANYRPAGNYIDDFAKNVLKPKA